MDGWLVQNANLYQYFLETPWGDVYDHYQEHNNDYESGDMKTSGDDDSWWSWWWWGRWAGDGDGDGGDGDDGDYGVDDDDDGDGDDDDY